MRRGIWACLPFIFALTAISPVAVADHDRQSLRTVAVKPSSRQGLGIYDYRNRSFDPATGRFLQRDPVLGGDPLYNPYCFPGNNPVTGSDPMGTRKVRDPEDFNLAKAIRTRFGVQGVDEFWRLTAEADEGEMTTYAEFVSRYSVLGQLEHGKGMDPGAFKTRLHAIIRDEESGVGASFWARVKLAGYYWADGFSLFSVSRADSLAGRTVAGQLSEEQYKSKTKKMFTGKAVVMATSMGGAGLLPRLTSWKAFGMHAAFWSTEGLLLQASEDQGSFNPAQEMGPWHERYPRSATLTWVAGAGAPLGMEAFQCWRMPTPVQTVGQPELFWHGSAPKVAERQLGGLFVDPPGAAGKYWATTSREVGSSGLSIGGNTNVVASPPFLVNKGGIEATYALRSWEAGLFRRAWGPSFSWNPYSYWKGAAGQYYFQPTPVTVTQRLAELRNFGLITGAGVGGAWSVSKAMDKESPSSQEGK